jgi:hypothetical protein
LPKEDARTILPPATGACYQIIHNKKHEEIMHIREQRSLISRPHLTL